MKSEDAVKLARRHHHAGRLADAETIYLQILQNQPDHPEALYLLGALKGQRGDIDAGIDLIRRAIGFRPNAAEAHRNLGVLFAQQDRMEEAFNAFSRAAQLQPDSPHIHQDIGKILMKQNRPDEAIAAYSKAISLKPDFVEAHLLLGNALSAMRRYDEALAAYTRVAQVKSDSAEAHYNIGLMLGKKGRPDEAIRAFLRAVQLKPDFAAAFLHLGLAYRDAGQLAEALDACRRAAQIGPDYMAHISMAMILAELHRFDEALASHALAAELQPDHALTHEVLGQILLRQRGADAAIEHFRRAVAADPSRIAAWNSLGVALQSRGDFDEAAACFRRMLELRPDLTVAHARLVNTNRQKASNQEIQPLIALLNQPGMPPEQRIGAEFALGTALDDAGQYDEAFAHFLEANAGLKAIRAAVGERYDPGQFRALVDQWIETFTPGFFEQRRGWGEPSELPVFVVGMARSGTTLVQQIAASHSRVYGAGELGEIVHIAHTLSGSETEIDVSGWDSRSVTMAAQKHLQRLQAMGPTAARVVDKMPSNLQHLGLIALLFPSARVILCRRDPRDTCLSCYFQGFVQGNSFSFDLAHCGHYHVQNDRLAAHWLRVLPLAILEVQYENVVADLEGQSRRLISFIGLDWEPACLEFYRAHTTVLTSSAWQVRQPIYKSSVGRWRHYERHLGPLLESLRH